MRRRYAVWAAAGALALALMGLAGPHPQPSFTLEAALAGDGAVRMGARDLRAAMTQGGALPLRWVTAGRLASPEVQAEAARREVRLPPLDHPEAYVIQPVPGPDPGVLVAGGGARGVAYGLLALAEDVRLQQPYLAYPVPIRASPDFDVRLLADPLDPRYPGPEQALRWGYNAVMTEPWPALVLYERYDPALYDPSQFGAARAWVETRRREARAELQQAKALGLKVIAPGDVILLPAQAQQLYGRELTAGGLTRYCIQHPRVQAMLAAAFDELFATFPEIDGILVRTGENYPIGPLSGNTPVSGACSPQGADSLAATLRFLHEQVVARHGRELIYRGWDLGATGVHALGEGGRRLAAAVPGARNTTLSYKITETDFWRYNRVNPNLLEPGLPRMVELQAAREYEGKGAFPNYVTAIHAAGLPEAAGDRGLAAVHAAGVRQAWVWAKGGGWDGPHVYDPLWVEANAVTLGRLLWDVHADPRHLAEDWAAGRFGRAAAPAIAEMLMRSADAVLKGFYLACYAPGHGPWTPNALWVRDDIVLGADKLRELYRGCGGAAGAAQAIAEKDAALAAVRAMEQAAEPALHALGDGPAATTLRAGLVYQRTLFETLRHYLAGTFSYLAYLDGRRTDPVLRAQASLTLQQALDAWQAHQQAVADHGTATPYRDAGMLQAIHHALEDLQRP